MLFLEYITIITLAIVLRKIFLRILIILLTLQMSGIFGWSGVFVGILDTTTVYAQSPSTPIYTVYRDATGLENITNTVQSLSWDTQVAEDSEIQIDGTNTSFDLSAGGHYLVMYSVPVRSTGGGNRSEVQSWLQLNGTTDIPYSYASSYIRRANSDFEGYNEGATVIDVSAGDNIALNIQKTDSNSATMQRTPGRSGINILKLDDDWGYARVRPTSSQAITTSWTNVNLGITDELDSGDFSKSGNDITLSTVGKYLVTYSAGTITTGNDRTNNEMRLTLDGTEIDATRSTAYVRAQNGSFVGIASYIGIIETTSSNQILNLEIMRESSMQGTTNNTIANKTGLTITKLPDSADYIRILETTGGQDITTVANTPITFDTTIEQGISLEHDTVTTSEIDVVTAGDYMLFHSIYNRRTGTVNGPRENPYLEWQVGGVTLDYGVSGSYNRNANDSDGITNSSHSSAGVIIPSLIPGDTIELTETNEATAAPSVYAGGFMGIQGVNLSTLFTGSSYLSQSSYRWRNDSVDFNSNGGWLAAENINIANIGKNDSLRLRMKVENDSGFVYDSDSQFELQWAKTFGSCTSGLSWVSISDDADAWQMVDTPNISPNAEMSSTQLLTNLIGNTHLQSEGYHNNDGETLLTPANTFTNSSQKEYEFSLKPTVYAEDNTIYCFRLYDTVANDDLGINNFPKLQMGSTPVILDDIWGEAGKINAPANGGWTTLTFEGGPYTSPVIVGRTNTYNDGNEALVFEARNVTSTTAEVRLCDSNAGNATGCQAHAIETIGYIVVDAAQTSSIDGVEAGTFSVDESFDTAGGQVTTSYAETFSVTPYVFTSVQTTTGDSPIVTRVEGSNNANFTGGICQQTSTDDCNPTHPTETFGWIALDPNVNPFFKDMDIGSGVSSSPSNLWSTATFSTSFDSAPVAISQTVTNLGGQDVQIDEIQNVTTTGMEFRACEIDNDDDCDTHAIDTIRWLAIEEGVFATEYFFDETHYRWYENNGSITPVTPLAPENTIISSLPLSQQVRLRMLLKNADPALPASVLSLKLQYTNSLTCESAVSWTDVGALGGGEDWLHFDNPGVTDGSTLTNSLLFGGGHSLQSYNESLPTVSNPNPIGIGEWGEWDFSLVKNPGATGDEYCFRVVTENNNEIEYSSYAIINTSDNVDPVISSYTPTNGKLLPIGNFELDYTISDADSGIDINNYDLSLQKWDGSVWGSDISSIYESVDIIDQSGATFNIHGLPYGKYRVIFEIFDNAGNSTSVTHELYVDAVEFTISTSEIDVGDIDVYGSAYTSTGVLVVTVKTVGAGFDVIMSQQNEMSNASDVIPNWDGTKGFGYEDAPYGTIKTIGSGSTIASESANININGEKNTYIYDIKYSVLLDIMQAYPAGDYESLVNFLIELDYD